jgi:hypothetical protein
MTTYKGRVACTRGEPRGGGRHRRSPKSGVERGAGSGQSGAKLLAAGLIGTAALAGGYALTSHIEADRYSGPAAPSAGQFRDDGAGNRSTVDAAHQASPAIGVQTADLTADVGSADATGADPKAGIVPAFGAAAGLLQLGAGSGPNTFGFSGQVGLFGTFSENGITSVTPTGVLNVAPPTDIVSNHPDAGGFFPLNLFQPFTSTTSSSSGLQISVPRDNSGNIVGTPFSPIELPSLPVTNVDQILKSLPFEDPNFNTPVPDLAGTFAASNLANMQFNGGLYTFASPTGTSAAPVPFIGSTLDAQALADKQLADLTNQGDASNLSGLVAGTAPGLQAAGGLAPFSQADFLAPAPLPAVLYAPTPTADDLFNPQPIAQQAMASPASDNSSSVAPGQDGAAAGPVPSPSSTMMAANAMQLPGDGDSAPAPAEAPAPAPAPAPAVIAAATPDQIADGGKSGGGKTG